MLPNSRPALGLCLLGALASWSAPARADLDLAFVLDTTGSMSGELAEAKNRVRQLSEALAAARPDETVRIGVVAYRDQGDAYVTQVSPLSEDVEISFEFLSRLRAQGGGDAPEDVLAGLEAALEELDWSEGAERQAFLIGDAPAHLDYADHPELDELLARARAQRVVLNAIGCRSLGPGGVEQYRRIAYGTEGQYHHIGRVQTGDGGLAEAMLRTLTEEQAEGPREAIAVFPSHAGPPPAAAELATRGISVRLGEWTAERRRADWGEATCLLTVTRPEGIGGADPVVELGEDGLHVELLVRSRAHGGSGGLFHYELGRCLPPDTPVHVDLVSVPSGRAGSAP